VVRPGLPRGALARLEAFLRPFLQALRWPKQRTNARHYVQGLLSDLGSKDAKSIAYLHDRERQGLLKFIGQADWDHRPLLIELARQVGAELGEADGVMVFDPSAFPKKEAESVGVQRQWCFRLGNLDNCQFGVYLGYASRREHALVDVRLYLPQEWATDRRGRKAGVPKEVRFRTQHELALDVLDGRGPLLPHGWVTGDDEMGRPSWFRQVVHGRGREVALGEPGFAAAGVVPRPEGRAAGCQ
jgi:SRSO17 transposase